MDQETSSKVWSRLLTGGDVRGLGLPTIAGRVDLRGLRAPDAELIRTIQLNGTQVQEWGGMVVVRSARWEGLDFSNATLPSLRFFDVAMENCVFERAQCRGWRAWRITMKNCSFVRASLRDFAMGAVEGLRNRYEDVDFSRADLRGSGHGSAHFARCTFANANLAKVDFHGDVFEDCTFAGELREVEFWRMDTRVGFAKPAPGVVLPFNEMLRVDMSAACLRWVTFHDLDLDTMRLPADPNHIIVENAPRVLAAVHHHFETSLDESEQKLAMVFETMKRHNGNGFRTIVHREDLLEMGERTLQTFLDIMRRTLAVD